MQYYRFWLDELNPALAKILVADPAIKKYSMKKNPVQQQFYHGDSQETGTLRFDFRNPDPVSAPTAVEVPGDWPQLPWLLLQVTLLEKRQSRTA